MRIQCPECGILRPADANPCPSCGADAPPSGGTRAGGGTSLRQWKERYQTGQLPGISPDASGMGTGRQLNRRTSGSLTGGQGQSSPDWNTRSNPDWGNESPASSIPPSGGLTGRRSGSLTPPPGTLPPTRKSGNLSSPLWQRATDPTPPPPSRSSGLLSNAARNSGSEFGNTSTSWKWPNQDAPASGRASGQLRNPAYDDHDDYRNDAQAEPPNQPSGRSRSSMLPVPYQANRQSWDQTGYDDESGSSANLPMSMGRQNSMAFPMMEDSGRHELPPGRKPPAFIPATRQRRPYRLSQYRIVSGTISVVLVVLALAGTLGFLAVHFGLAQHIFGSTTLSARQNPYTQQNLPTLSGTPQATPSGNTASQIIVKVVTAQHYSSTYDPISPTTIFQTGQNGNVLWQGKQGKANDVISVIWYQNNSAITEPNSPNTQEKITKAGPIYNGLFALCYPTSGLGKAELYWNGQLAQTIIFVVKGNQASCSGS